MMTTVIPDFSFEKEFVSSGYFLIAGIDEAGRAPLAGPVTAGAVILDLNLAGGWIDEVRDSKAISRSKRNRLEIEIKKSALAWGLGFSSNHEIDQHGIARATRLAMKAAIETLNPAPQAILIDYFRLPELNLPQKGIPHGDSLCNSIACASILAKVARDRLMDEMDIRYPGYGFSHNKGYPTPDHFKSLAELGPCPIHRQSFFPLKPRLNI